MGKASAEAAIQTCTVPNLFIIASSIDLTGASVELVDQEEREYFLKRSLLPLVADYDYVFIDCPLPWGCSR